MAHPYPPRWSSCSYTGQFRYSLTFVTDGRRPLFTEASIVDLVLTQILRAGSERQFELLAYCFMPDHVHLAAAGETNGSDGKAFIKAAKQYSGYYYARGRNGRLWERYSYDRVIRDDMELALTIGYLVENPVRAGLVSHPRDYPFLGSQRYTVAELLEWCEYRGEPELPPETDLPPEGGSHASGSSA